MAQLGVLLQGIASLIWALVGLGVIVLGLAYRKHVGALISRLRRAKILGQEFELDSIQEKGEPRIIDGTSVPVISNPQLPALPNAEQDSPEEGGQ